MSSRKLLPSSLFIFFLLTVGCTVSNTVQPNGDSRIPIAIHLPWTHEYIFAPFYSADKNGHFADQGLEVELVEGGFQDGVYKDSITPVLEGTADFGITDGFNLILARAEGKPLVAIFALIQRSPNAIISLKESQIRRPQDLIGKTLAFNAGGADWTYNAMLLNQGIDRESINIVPRTTGGTAPLFNGEVDAITGWIINEGIELQLAGYDPNFIVMSDYGTDTYASVIFTTEQLIAEQPALVDNLVQAMVFGSEDVIRDPTQAAELTLQYNENLDLEGQERRLVAALPFFNPAGSRLGMMDDRVWRQTQLILLDQGVLDEPINIESAYTLEFIKDDYGISGQAHDHDTTN